MMEETTQNLDVAVELWHFYNLQFQWDAFQGIGCWELNASVDQADQHSSLMVIFFSQFLFFNFYYSK